MKSDAQQSNTSVPKPTSKLAVRPRYGGVLRIADTYVLPRKLGVPGRMNVGAPSLEPIVEHFLRVDRAGQMVPHLIESWEYSKDGMQLTLHVKKGIKFHDGTDLNAKAAKWNLLKASEIRGTLKVISSIDVVDDYTILLKMKGYDNTFLSNLAFSSGFVLSPTAYETYGEELAMVNPVGTGPFKFVSYEPDVKIVAERFDDYWQEGKPYLDKIEIRYAKDMMTGVNALRAGEVDVVVNINGESAAALKSGGYIITALPWTMEGLLPDSLNLDSPLADKRVRQAIEYAIDRPAIADALGHGYWRALNQLATEAVYGYNPDIEGRPYNPDKAKQMLVKAGYPDGFKTKLIGGEGTELQKIFSAIQKYLADVGIEADIEIASAALWKEYRADKPWHNAMLFRHYASEPNFSWTMTCGYSIHEYGQTSMLRNFDNIIIDMLQVRNYTTMVKNTRKVVKHLHNEALIIPIMVDSSIAAASDKVHDLGYFEVHIRYWTPWNAWVEQ